MTNDEVFAMAKQAAFITPVMEGELMRFAALVEDHLKSKGYRQCAVGQRTTQFCGMLEDAVKAERESCAKVCDKRSDDDKWEGHYAHQCAAAIRSRNG